MKILLTTLNSKHIHTSLALRYLYSYCQNSFPQLTLREFTINQDPDYILGEIYAGNYQVVCFSCYIWNIEATLKLVTNLKKIKPQLIIVLGGPEVSFDPVQTLENNQAIDYIVRGEGEVTFKELLSYLLEGKGKPEEIAGLAYRQGQEIKMTDARPLITPLDQLPFPYTEEELARINDKIIYYESSRGCPFCCSYCLSSTVHGVRFFSLERVKKDLQHFLKAKVKQVKFVDRTFNAKKSHFLEIMRFLQEQDNGYTNFHFEITAELLDQETLDFLAQVREGLFQFEIGVQTTNPDTLKAIRRPANFAKLKAAVEKLSSYKNIHLHLDLIAGLPYEDYASFKKSFNDVYALKPQHLQLGFLKLLKGSPIREEKELHGYIHKEEPPYEVLASKYLSYQELLRLKRMEELLERYYNSGHFTYSLDYLMANFYAEPAQFYEDLSLFWEHHGLHHLAHSTTELYALLLKFYEEKNFPQREVFAEILKLDYLCQGKGTPPPFLPRRGGEELKHSFHQFLQNQENVAKYLPQYLGLPAKKIMKLVHFEVFKYDITQIISQPKEKRVVAQPTTLLFDYNLDRKIFARCRFFKIHLPKNKE